MQDTKPANFIRLADGTLLQREEDGSYRPTKSLTNLAWLDALTDDEIDQMAAGDPDHPALDDAFWASADEQQAAKEARSIRVDTDILAYFRQQGEGHEARINDVLRRYVDAQQKERC